MKENQNKLKTRLISIVSVVVMVVVIVVVVFVQKIKVKFLLMKKQFHVQNCSKSVGSKRNLGQKKLAPKKFWLKFRSKKLWSKKIWDPNNFVVQQILGTQIWSKMI